MTKKLKKLSEITIDQRVYFFDWLVSDNTVCESDPNGNKIWRAQCNQYVSRFTFEEIVDYWWKEYGKYIEDEDYEDMGETCRNGKEWSECDCC